MPEVPCVEYPTTCAKILPAGYFLVSFPSASVNRLRQCDSVGGIDTAAHDAARKELPAVCCTDY